MVKPSQVQILLVAMGLMLVSSAVHAQVTTTETLTFDNNQLPTGWNYFHLPAPGSNVNIQNQRLEVGQVDTYGGIYRSFDSSNVTQIIIEYDANIADVYWGQINAALLVNDTMNWSAGSASASMRKIGYGQNSMAFEISQQLSGVTWTGYDYQNVMAPVFGNYHMNAVFENGQISQTVTNLDTGASFSSGVTAVPGFLLSNMHNVLLFGATTTGTSAWIDNATITGVTTTGTFAWIDNATTTVTAVPEPETYAMLLAGLSLLGFAGRRRKDVAA